MTNNNFAKNQKVFDYFVFNLLIRSTFQDGRTNKTNCVKINLAKSKSPEKLMLFRALKLNYTAKLQNSMQYNLH